jgi:hypothetical protein
MLNQRARECTPQRRGSSPRWAALIAAAAVLAAPAGLPAALADEGPAREEALAELASLDGYYLALGPRAGALYAEGEWDGAFGVEVSAYRYRASHRLSLLGISGGMVQLSEIDGGHAFAEVGAGTDLARGARVGASAGITSRLSPIRHPRYGGHLTLWSFVGAIPYVRAGVLQDTGMFVDFGIRLALPALRL